MNKPPNPPRKGRGKNSQGRGKGVSQPGGSSSNEQQALIIPKRSRVYYSYVSGTIAGVKFAEKENEPRPRYPANKPDSPLTDSEPEKVEVGKDDVGEEEVEDDVLAMANFYAKNAILGGGKRNN